MKENVLYLDNSEINVVNTKSERLIVRIINYLNENYTSQIRLEQLADKFFINKYYLQHLFKKHMGVTVMEYVTNKRILKIQCLMEEGCKISVAANMCGFNDYSSFYRAYVKHTGTKPSYKSNK